MSHHSDILSRRTGFGAGTPVPATAFSLPPLSEYVGDGPPPNAAAIHTLLGRYRLGRILGEGGMGTVYLAEQVEPVTRTVAVKLIKPGLAHRDLIERFAAERQALARMDHPNIARVFDAGTSPQGQPYFVMEYVDGPIITQFCNRQDLTVRDKLELFLPICAAVQHAHQKGIIHRDLKPGNILVGQTDGRPAPKVIDFGLAKAALPLPTGAADLTRIGTIVGTPQYMAPEQATGSGHDVDTRADVYALGVILYELLTGSPPLSRLAVEGASYEELLPLIRDHSAPKPSDRIAAGAGEGIRRQLRGDLDWIVMKALEKDRSRRYDSASALADDIRRHLAHAPVTAGPQSRRYLLGRFLRRHRGPMIAASTVLFALLIGMAGTAIGLVRATVAEEAARRDAAAAGAARQAEAAARAVAEVAGTRAVAEADKARHAAEESNAVLTFLRNHVLNAARPVGLHGGLGINVTVREALLAAGPAIEQAFAGQPLREAVIRAELATTCVLVSAYEQAILHQEKAVVLRRLCHPANHPQILAVQHRLAELYATLGHPEKAIALYDAVLVHFREQFGPDHPETITCACDATVPYIRAHRSKAGVPLAEKALADAARILGPRSEYVVSTATTLGRLYEESGRPADAAAAFERAFAAAQNLEKSHSLRIHAGHYLANSYTRLGRWDEAANRLVDLLAAYREHDPDMIWTRGLMQQLLGICRYELHQPGAAEPMLREALSLFDRAPKTTDQCITQAYLGMLLLDRGDPAGRPLLEAGYDDLVWRAFHPGSGESDVVGLLHRAADRLQASYGTTPRGLRIAEQRRNFPKESAPVPRPAP